MPHVIVSAEVTDVQHWLNSPKREEVFPRGYTEIKTYVDIERSNRVALTMNVPDLDAARADDGLRQEEADAMEYDAVIPETVVSFVES